MKTARELRISEFHRVNLAGLCVGILEKECLPGPPVGFRMGSYARSTPPRLAGYLDLYPHQVVGVFASGCNSAACLLGHAPLVGVGNMAAAGNPDPYSTSPWDSFVNRNPLGTRFELGWNAFSIHNFGAGVRGPQSLAAGSLAEYRYNLWRWLFGGTWENSERLGALRIAWFLENGLPEEEFWNDMRYSRGAFLGYDPDMEAIGALARSRGWKSPRDLAASGKTETP